jgi:peroxiredoxin
MMMKHVFPIVVLMAGLAPVSSFAAKVGDPAAPLTIKQWIKDSPVDVRDGKHIYVLEFWAAANPASRASIFKLSELQKKYEDKGVIVVGISDEPADTVLKYVKMVDNQIQYSIAVDDEDKTTSSYMVAYGQSRFPYAFIVGKDGKVLWHGPLAGLDQVLDEITAGRYDLQKMMKLDAARAEVDEYRTLARAGDPKAGELGRKLLAAMTNTNDVIQLCSFAFRIATDRQNTNRDLALAGEALDRAEKLAPAKTAQLVLTRGVVLFESGKQAEGVALAKQALDLAKSKNEKAFVNMNLSVMEKRKNAEDERKNADEKKGDQGPIKTNAPLEQVPTPSNALIHPNP